MQLSTYLELQVGNWLKGTDMDAAPGALTLALSTADPTDTGAALAEPVGGAYVRQAITFDAPVVNAAGVNIASTAAITFPVATGNWGTITHVAVFAGADMLFFGPLSATKLVLIGNTISFAANGIQHTFKTRFSDFFGSFLANWVRGTTAPTAPATIQMALSTADITKSGGGLSEPPGTDGYARQNITLGALSSVTGTGTTVANTNTIIFGPANTNDWPPVAHAGIFEGTNLLVFGSLAASRSAEIGDSVPLSIGSISLLIR